MSNRRFIFGVCKNKILSVMVGRVRLGGATAGYWIFCRIFQDYWQRVCLTMIDKNIVIAVSMKHTGLLTMSSLDLLDTESPKSVLGKKIIRALWNSRHVQLHFLQVFPTNSISMYVPFLQRLRNFYCLPIFSSAYVIRVHFFWD